MPGPAPVPTNVLDARGSWRANTRPDEPQLEVKIPRPPPGLDRGAKNVWKRITRILKASRVITESDADVVAAYCQAVADERRLRRHLDEVGWTWESQKTGYIGLRPECTLLRRAQKDRHQLGQQLGLTPASRTRVKVVKSTEDPGDKERFFK